MYARVTAWRSAPPACRSQEKLIPSELGMEHQEADDGPLETETPGEEPRAEAFQDRAGADPFQRLPVEPGHDRGCLARNADLRHGGTVPRAMRAPQATPAPHGAAPHQARRCPQSRLGGRGRDGGQPV